MPLAVQQERAAALRSLHDARELLRLVNVWDVASARVVADVPGCRALATASAAVAAAHGYDDGERIPLELHLAVVQRICAAVGLPVTVDLERGYGHVPLSVGAAIDAGAVGCNLEDDMCPVDEMHERVSQAVAVGQARAVPIVVNARPDVYLLRRDWPEGDKLAEARTRGLAYLDAGADCVFVPGCTDEASIAALVSAFGPGRLSLLAVPGTPAPSRLEEMGVARLSHGPYPQRHALGALADHARDCMT